MISLIKTQYWLTFCILIIEKLFESIMESQPKDGLIAEIIFFLLKKKIIERAKLYHISS